MTALKYALYVPNRGYDVNPNQAKIADILIGNINTRCKSKYSKMVTNKKSGRVSPEGCRLTNRRKKKICNVFTGKCIKPPSNKWYDNLKSDSVLSMNYWDSKQGGRPKSRLLREFGGTLSRW